MVNSKRDREPAGAGPATTGWWGGLTAFLRFRSPDVLAGGRAIRRGTYAPVGHGIGGLGVHGGGDLLGKVLKRVRRLFPERQILVRAEGRVSYVTLSHRAQIVMATGGFAVVALVAYGLITPFHQVRPAPPAAPAAAPGPDLQAQVDDLQRKLDAANAQLEQAASAASIAANQASIDEAQAQVKLLEEARDRAVAEQSELQRQLAQAQDAANNRSQSLAQANRTLDASKGELRQSDAQRQALQARLHQLELELDGANTRSNQAKNDLATNERKLQQLAAEHDRTVAERNRLQVQITELQNRAAAAPVQSGAAESAPAAPAPAPAQRSIADHPPDRRSDNTGKTSEVERLLASTGIDVEKLLSHLSALPPGQGGPYVALDKANMPGAGDARSEELQKIIKTLPLAAPLAHYEISSGFGGRSDPFHGKQAFHAGVDFTSAYRAPILATAPGTVIFTGVKDNYGKVVEIDHGHGIVTRYAHLHRIVVPLGQRVQARQQVAELGSTGRSTGPHLHYEVLVNGVAQDPEKFLQAGKNVVQARN
jgi:murein DD-endopeptidase MepM/ murein hydrolase activator NlpD